MSGLRGRRREGSPGWYNRGCYGLAQKQVSNEVGRYLPPAKRWAPPEDECRTAGRYRESQRIEPSARPRASRMARQKRQRCAPGRRAIRHAAARRFRHAARGTTCHCQRLTQYKTLYNEPHTTRACALRDTGSRQR